jgi:hypothetical protein
MTSVTITNKKLYIYTLTIKVRLFLSVCKLVICADTPEIVVYSHNCLHTGSEGGERRAIRGADEGAWIQNHKDF